jgi:hypothetical protein
MSPFCSSVVPVFVVLNTTATSGSSVSALSHPLRTIFQKSEVLLVINATVFTALAGFGGDAQLTDRTKIRVSKQKDFFMAGVSLMEDRSQISDLRSQREYRVRDVHPD